MKPCCRRVFVFVMHKSDEECERRFWEYDNYNEFIINENIRMCRRGLGKDLLKFKKNENSENIYLPYYAICYNDPDLQSCNEIKNININFQRLASTERIGSLTALSRNNNNGVILAASGKRPYLVKINPDGISQIYEIDRTSDYIMDLDLNPQWNIVGVVLHNYKLEFRAIKQISRSITMRLIKSKIVQFDNVVRIAWSPTGTRFAVVSSVDNDIGIYELPNFYYISKNIEDYSPLDIVFIDESRIAIINKDGGLQTSIKILNIEKNSEIWSRSLGCFAGLIRPVWGTNNLFYITCLNEPYYYLLITSNNNFRLVKVNDPRGRQLVFGVWNPLSCRIEPIFHKIIINTREFYCVKNSLGDHKEICYDSNNNIFVLERVKVEVIEDKPTKEEILQKINNINGIARIEEIEETTRNNNLEINIIREYVAGKTLAELLARPHNQRLRREEKSRIIRGIISVGRQLWNNQMCHGDLRPENIIIQENRNGNLTVKLIDYENLIKSIYKCDIEGCIKNDKERICNEIRKKLFGSDTVPDDLSKLCRNN